ncbi:MAG: heme-degrading domain-containing protein [Janthinobacterium lividum]
MISALPNAAEDLPILEEQEQRLRFATFDANSAWALGSRLREAAMERKAGCSVEIELAGHVLFACVTTGATAGQANWIRRKRNTVHHFARSTYAVGRKLERDGGTLMSRHALSEIDYAAHGGGFPLWLNGTGPVGSVVFSGLPQRDDHNIVVEVLTTFLGIDVPRLG